MRLWVLLVAVGLETGASSLCAPPGSAPRTQESTGRTAEVNLLMNGSFEQPGSSAWSGLGRGSTYITGWVITRDTVDLVTLALPCSHGNFCLDLDGTPGFGAIAQSFTTTPGARYTVTFDIAGNPDGPPAVKQLRVSAAGQQADFSFDTAGRSRAIMGWTTKTWVFTASSNQTTLEFASLDTVGGSTGPMLDNVWVTAGAGAACTYAISPSSAAAPSAGTTGSVAVTAPAGCAWTAASSASWITITAGASGAGNGTVSYTVAPSTGASSRTGTVSIAGQTFTVTQAGAGAACTYAISPSSAAAPSAGTTGSVAVTAPAGCAWTAASNASWITITAGASGTANGLVSYGVAANTGASARTGTVTVAGLTFTVDQAAASTARPRINPKGVVNAADYTGVAAPGGMLAIFGTNLASATRAASGTPLPTTLDGVSVDIYDGNTVRSAPLFFVSSGQINAQLPFETVSATVQVRVRTANGESLVESLGVAERAPRLFTKSQDGSGEPILMHADYTFVSPTSPARLGETLMAYVTGIGAVRPAQVTGRPGGDGGSLGPLNVATAPVMVRIGDQNVRAVFTGLAPGFVGVYQVNFAVPAETPPGWQEVTISCEEKASQSGVRFFIRDLPSPSTKVSLGRSGGSVQAAGIRVDIPAGALTDTANLALTEIPVTVQEGLVSGVYALEGVPAAIGAPIEISLDLVRNAAAGSDTYVVVEGSVGGQAALGVALLPARIEGTRIKAILAADSLMKARAVQRLRSGSPAAAANGGPPPGVEWELRPGALSLKLWASQVFFPTTSRPGGSFEVSRPPLIEFPALDKRLEHLEAARNIIEQTIGLRWGPELTWRREIYLQRFFGRSERRYWGDATPEEGDTTRAASGWSITSDVFRPYAFLMNWQFLGANDSSGLRFLDMASGRELFGLYQRSYCPTCSSPRDPGIPANWWWLNEASSTWFQHYFAQGGPESPYQALETPARATRNSFDFLLRRGLEPVFHPTPGVASAGTIDAEFAAFEEEVRKHGSGAAMFIHFLVRKRGSPTLIRDIFESWKKYPSSGVELLDSLIPGGVAAAWREFCGEWMAGQVYPRETFPSPGEIVSRASQPLLDLRHARMVETRWAMEDLSARLFEIALPTNWASNKKIQLQVQDASRQAAMVIYAFTPGSPARWRLIKTARLSTEIENAGQLASEGARLFVLVCSGYMTLISYNEVAYTLTAGDPNLLPELNRALDVYVNIDASFLGEGYLAAGHASLWTDNYTASFIEDLRLVQAWESPGSSPGSRRRFVVSGRSESGQPDTPSYRARELSIALEFSDDGYTVQRADVYEQHLTGVSGWDTLRYTLRNIPFGSVVDYRSHVPPRRECLFQISGRDKQANLPYYFAEINNSRGKGSSNGLNWTDPRYEPTFRVGVRAPLQ